MAKQYRLRPVVVTAHQILTNQELPDIIEVEDGKCYVDTAEGKVEVKHTNFIVVEEDGSRTVYTAMEFFRKFESLTEQEAYLHRAQTASKRAQERAFGVKFPELQEE
jgi:hypothetical protein